MLMFLLTLVVFVITVPLKLARFTVKSNMKMLETEGKVKRKKRKKAEKKGKIPKKKKKDVRSRLQKVRPKNKTIKDLPKRKQISYYALRGIRNGLTALIALLNSLSIISLIISIIVILVIIAIISIVASTMGVILLAIMGDDLPTTTVTQMTQNAKPAKGSTDGGTTTVTEGKKHKYVRYPKQGGDTSIPLLYQGDYAGYDLASGHTISSSGCGFTSMAMILSRLSGKHIEPDEMCKKLRTSGGGTYMYVVGGGMSNEGGRAIFEKLKKTYGIKGYKAVSVTKGAQFKKYAAKCYPQLLLTHGYKKTSLTASRFTTNGHYIVCRGCTKGKYYINDPNGRARGNAGRAGKTQAWWENHGWTYKEVWGEVQPKTGCWAFVPTGE